MNFIKLLKDKWFELSMLGINSNMDLNEQRMSKVTNQLILGAIIITCLYPPILLAVHLPLFSLFMLFFIFYEISLLFLSKKGNHEIAIVGLLFVLAIYVTGVSIVRPGSNTEVFLLPFSLFGFGAFSKKRVAWLFFMVIVTAFFSSLIIQHHSDPIIKLNHDIKLFISIFNYVIIFVTCLFFIFILLSSHTEYVGMLVKQKEQIEAHHKLVQDSIKYAKRIQGALLPSQQQFEKNLKDAFVFYQPKDIVAGDFYWNTKLNNKTYFAVADCTGHGIPGALLSVLCYNALNRTFKEFGLESPGEILDKAREIIIDEFSKSGQEVADGMDIALCAIEDKKLLFSGANNPLWIIRNNELIELKADRQPVGNYPAMKKFTTQEFELKKDDKLYLFSDGYADQFGGSNHKKFYKKPFKNKLLSISHLPMETQLNELAICFNDWKGDIEQTDDVCVLGFKVE